MARDRDDRERSAARVEIERALRLPEPTDAEWAFLYELARRDIASGFEGDPDFQPEPILLSVLAKLARMRSSAAEEE